MTDNERTVRSDVIAIKVAFIAMREALEKIKGARG
jgi:hypothetical protein